MQVRTALAGRTVKDLLQDRKPPSDGERGFGHAQETQETQELPSSYRCSEIILIVTYMVNQGKYTFPTPVFLLDPRALSPQSFH